MECPRTECPFHEQEWDRRFKELEAMAQRTQSMLQWGVGLLVTVGLALGSLVYGSIDARMKAVEVGGSPPMRERVARAEGDIQAIQKSLDEIKSGQREILQRLERR